MASDPNGQVQPANVLWTDLWNKQQLLYDYLQELNTKLIPSDRPNYAGDFANAQFEIERIEAILDSLNSNSPIPFPSDDEILAIRRSVGILHQAVTASAQVTELVAAATTVIKSWPLSRSG